MTSTAPNDTPSTDAPNTRPDSAGTPHADTGRTDTGHADAPYTDAGSTESGHAGTSHTDTGHADTPYTDAGSTGSRHAGTSYTEAGRPPLRRSRTDLYLGGVCAGLARHTGIDALLWRVGFAALVLAGGSGVALYLVLWLLMPAAPAGPTDRTNVLDEWVERLRARFTRPTTDTVR